MGKSVVLAMCVTLGLGCGDDDAPNCPPDFPVERDGFCYRADDAGEDAFIPLDGSSDTGAGDATVDAPAQDTSAEDGGGDDAGGVDSGPGDAGGTDGGDAGAICTGTHPLVEGERRFCEEGDCFCATPDACFPAAIAATCCEVDVVCE